MLHQTRNTLMRETEREREKEREKERNGEEQKQKERKKEDDRVYTSVVPSSETTDRMAQNSLATAAMAPRSLPASHPTHTALLPGSHYAMGP